MSFSTKTNMVTKIFMTWHNKYTEVITYKKSQQPWERNEVSLGLCLRQFKAFFRITQVKTDSCSWEKPGSSTGPSADLPMFSFLLSWRSIHILSGDRRYDTGLFDSELIHLGEKQISMSSHSMLFHTGKMFISLTTVPGIQIHSRNHCRPSHWEHS